MKVFLLLIVLLLAGGLLYFFLARSSPSFHTIHINDSGYVPDRISIKAGEGIFFINNTAQERWPASNIHPAHDIYPEFDPKKPILPGESWSFVFDKKGIWRFHDHLRTSLSGVVIVE